MLSICIETEALTVGQIIKALELYDKDTEVRIQRTGEGGRVIQMSNIHAQIINEMDPGDNAVTIWLHDDKRIRHEEKDSVRPDLADKEISSVNLKAEISTPKDIERLRKLCNELQQSISSQEATPEKRGTYSDDSFLSLSGKELKELINKWIVYHAENDINLSPGYFERLLWGWETTYRRQCGMSMLNGDMDYAKMLMPINIYKNVLVQDGQIEVAGHICKKDGIERYNQQEMNIYELEDKFIVYDCNGLYITSINK